MSISRRGVIILLLAIALLAALAFRGRLFVGKWAETSDSDISRGYASPQAFAPNFEPWGDWKVQIDGAEGLKEEIGHWISARLSSAYSAEGRVQVVDQISDGFEPTHKLHIQVRPGSVWTPFYATYADSVEISYSNETLSGWPKSRIAIGTLVTGEMRIRGTLLAAGKSFGVIGQTYFEEHRAKVLADLIIQAISEAYKGVKEAAGSKVTERSPLRHHLFACTYEGTND